MDPAGPPSPEATSVVRSSSHWIVSAVHQLPHPDPLTIDPVLDVCDPWWRVMAMSTWSRNRTQQSTEMSTWGNSLRHHGRRQ
jgi:hypothetical protein